MVKSPLLASAICFAFILSSGVSFAQEATPAVGKLDNTTTEASQQGTAMAKIACDDASLTKMRTDIDAMTDADKKAKSMESWTAADTAFKANNLDECNARMGDLDKSDGNSSADQTDINNKKATTTQ